ncbi:hypothetical protein ACFLTD_03250 [Elusimicrobiota bacterium]
MPYFLFVEILNPFIEIAGYIVLGVSLVTGKLDHVFLISFLMLTIGMGILFTSLTLIIEELFYHKYSNMKDVARLLLASFLESFGYHQVLTLVKMKAIADKLLGNESWGKMERVGFTKSE